MTRTESEMNRRSSLASLFPLNYDRGIWLPAGLAVAGFAGLEMAIHIGGAAARAGMPDFLAEVREKMGFRFWEFLYRIGYSLLVIPILVPAARTIQGALRRLLVAYLLALGAGGLMAIFLRPGILEAVPCLLIAGCAIVTLFFARNRFFSMTALAAGATTTAALATLMIELHGPANIVSGLALGTIAFHLAFSTPLFFLDRPRPWTGIEHELDNLWNLLVSNSRQKWERTYVSGSWDFLNEPSQRGRHYAIAGVVADRHPDGGARVLDVGCGLGTLYPLLKGRVRSYSGLDLSEEVIKRCRLAFADDPTCSFTSGAFEDFAARETFDVVVLNEVLYYFRVSRAVEVFQKALSHAGDDGFVVISMNRSWKGRLIRTRLNAISPPVQSLRITNLQTGSFWTVEVYSRAKEETK